jgi:hypothetical protein
VPPRGERPASAGKRLSAGGEELIEVADRAGLDAKSQDELRGMLFDWSQRFARRGEGPTPSAAAFDTALVAVMVSYIRRFLSAS